MTAAFEHSPASEKFCLTPAAWAPAIEPASCSVQVRGKRGGQVEGQRSALSGPGRDGGSMGGGRTARKLEVEPAAFLAPG